jgi:hypothetical protein
MAIMVALVPGETGINVLTLKVLIGAVSYAFGTWAVDLGGARARLSAVSQSLASKVRAPSPLSDKT